MLLRGSSGMSGRFSPHPGLPAQISLLHSAHYMTSPPHFCIISQSRTGFCPRRARGHWDHSVYLVCERTRGARNHPARRQSERPFLVPAPHIRGRRRHRHRRRQQHRRDWAHDSRHDHRGSEQGEAEWPAAVLHLLLRVRAGPSTTTNSTAERADELMRYSTKWSERGCTETTRRP